MTKNKIKYFVIEFIILFVFLMIFYWIFYEEMNWLLIIIIPIVFPLSKIFLGWVTAPIKKEKQR